MYEKLKKGIETLINSDINSLILLSRTGLGKSEQLDRLTKDFNKSILTGYISEARFFKFLQDNNDKELIIIRDCGHLLNSRTFIDFLKSASEMRKVRKISRLNFKKTEEPQTFNFKSKIIWELNRLPKWSEDFEAIKSRSLFIELVLSKEEISQLMREISKNDKEKQVAEYLISQRDRLNNNFNLRTWHMCCQIAKNSPDISQVELFLDTQYSDIQKALYEFSGKENKPRKEFVRYLINRFDWSKRTAERRINDSLDLEEIYDNNLERNSLVSLVPFRLDGVTPK